MAPKSQQDINQQHESIQTTIEALKELLKKLTTSNPPQDLIQEYEKIPFLLMKSLSEHDSEIKILLEQIAKSKYIFP